MSGPVINAAGILAGGGCGLVFRKSIPATWQTALKIVLGVFTIWFGLRLSWASINGNFRQVLKELAIVLLAMALGKMLGRLLGLQRFSNSLGQYASRILAQPERTSFNDGFLVATTLFCAGPLAIFASVQEGFSTISPLFVIKAGTDGLAAYEFCSRFGAGVLFSALPVLAWESAIVLLIRGISPHLPVRGWPLADAAMAVDGLLVFCVAMLILELKKIQVADYYPSLILAPLLAWWWWPS